MIPSPIDRRQVAAANHYSSSSIPAAAAACTFNSVSLTSEVNTYLCLVGGLYMLTWLVGWRMSDYAWIYNLSMATAAADVAVAASGRLFFALRHGDANQIEVTVRPRLANQLSGRGKPQITALHELRIKKRKLFERSKGGKRQAIQA